jgi:hypothetical protein
MRLPTELLFLLSIVHPSTTAPTTSLNQRSTTFQSLRGLTHLSNDYSNQESYTNPTKFFHESTFSQHYDGRFASTELPHHTRLFHMRLMLKSYIETMDRIGVRTWLMHGCLLGWWWNGHIMPWDTDVDVMVDEGGIGRLGGWWNMSVHHFNGQELGIQPPEPSGTVDEDTDRVVKRLLHDEVATKGKKYLLEVNPYYTNTSTRDRENVIDARWIDTATGLFIDITTLHVQPILDSPSNPQDATAIELYTKDQHAYSSTQMFPLRLTTFESTPVHIPYDYEELLLDEYGPRSITQKLYKDFKFVEDRHEWVLVDGWGDEVVKEEDEEVVMERLRAARERMDYLERVGERQREGKERYETGP